MDYQVVEADLIKDRKTILSIWERNLRYPSPERESKFNWRFIDNPYGMGRCWLLFHGDSKEPVGTAGVYRRGMKFGNRSIIAGVAAHLAVDADHRNLMPALKLERAVVGAQCPEMPVIYTTPNEPSLPIFKRCGYRPVGQTTTLLKVLRSATYLRRMDRTKALTPILSGPVDLYIRATGAETWTRTQDLELRPLGGFDERFDALWDRASGQFEVTNERRAESLCWRHSVPQPGERVLLGLFHGNEDRLLGYAIAQVLRAETDGKLRVILRDLFLETMEVLLPGMLRLLLRWARAQDAVSLSVGYFGPERYLQVFQKFSFLQKGLDRPVMIYDKPLEGYSLPQSPENWYFAPGGD